MIEKQINEIFVRRKGKFLVKTNKVALLDKEDNTDNKFKVMYILTEELKRLGYRMSVDLSNKLISCALLELKNYGNNLISICRKLHGEADNMKSLFVNFSQKKYPNNTALKVLQYQYVDVKDDPTKLQEFINTYGDFFTIEEIENINIDIPLKRIDLGTFDELYDMFKELLDSKVSYSEQDKEDINTILESDFDISEIIHISEIIPSEFKIKENMAFVSKQIYECENYRPYATLIINKYIKTYTDVLRIAVAMSDGDVSLATPTKFKNFKRKERRFLLRLFNNLGSLGNNEDLLRHKSMFLRLGEKIHPGEYRDRYKDAFYCFNNLRNDAKKMKSNTFNSKLEKAYREKDLSKVLKLLKQRPGDFTRNLNRVLLLAQELGEEKFVLVTNAYAKVAHNKVPTSTLLTAMNYFENRNNCNDSRVFYPKGNVAKAYVVDNNLPSLNTDAQVEIAETLHDLIMDTLKEKSDLGLVYIDPAIKQYVAPLKLRDMSKTNKPVERGSKFDIKSNNIRFYCHWLNEIDEYGDEEETDLDLSVGLYDENFVMIDYIAFNNLFASGISHSGDYVNAPASKGGATEYIDIEFDKLKPNIRYIVTAVYSYSYQSFCQLPEAFVGYMEIPENAEIADYDAALSKIRLDLTTDQKNTVPCIIDVKEKKLIWTNLGSETSEHTILEGMGTNLTILETLLKTEKPNLYDLILMNALARGKKTDNIKEADIIFIEDKDKLDDNDTIRHRVIQKIVEKTDEDGNAIKDIEEDIEVYEAQIVTPYDTAYITSELL